MENSNQAAKHWWDWFSKWSWKKALLWIIIIASIRFAIVGLSVLFGD